jgi:uncharacterized protein YkwD
MGATVARAEPVTPGMVHLGNQPRCAGDAALVSPKTVERVAATTRCVVDRIRRRHGMHPLRRNAALERSAARYARRMVADRRFSEVSATGGTMMDRFRAGYLRGTTAYSAGEMLAWGTGTYGTASAIVAAWMHSPKHRSLLLTAGYRDGGLGVVAGVPVGKDAGAGATFDYELGWRAR